jgi:hypothetical protein
MTRLGLDNLGSPHFEAFRRYAGVVGHVLRFKGGHVATLAVKGAAYAGCHDTFSDIGTGAENSEATCWGFIFQCLSSP